MRTKFIIALMCLGLIFSAQVLFGQPNYHFKITGTDGVQLDSVVIGLHSSATYDVENVVFGVGDTIKEFEMPIPGMPGPFDYRVLDLPGRIRGAGAGQQFDIRHSASNPVQADTFIISFRSSDDDQAGKVTLSWPADLASTGYGGFILVPNNLPPPFNAPIDMTTQTSYEYPVKDVANSQTVLVIIGDGQMFRSFEAESLALAHDYKGKYQSEKRKNCWSKWTVTFTNNTGQTVAGLNVKFSQNVTQWLSGPTINPPVTLPSKGKFHFVTGNIPPLGTFVVSGIGDKGKAIVAKSALWTNAGNTVTVGAKFDGVGETQILLRMPNVWNVVEEFYLQPGNVDAVNGIPLGVPGASNKYVIHTKNYKSVLKTMNSKGVTHKGGTPGCLDTYATKAIKVGKPLKAYEPKKQKNELIAELLALKVNIIASKAGKIPTGFGGLTYKEPGSPFDGQTIDTIAAKGDQMISYCLTEIKAIPYTYADMLALLKKLNSSFSGTFDTLTFGSPSGTKSVGTSLGGVKPVLMLDYLYRTSGYVPPANNAKYQLEQIPEKFELLQNYPNPFNPVTTLSFNLSEDAFVTVKVYNMLGQEVKILADREEFTSGNNEIEFDASDLASGVYYYRLIVNNGQFEAVKKMMLLK